MVLKQIISDASTFIIALAAAYTACATVIKPLRKPFKKLAQAISGAKRDELIVEKLDKISDKLSNEIKAVSDKCDANERDRLREEIFKFGNFARKHQEISGEEFAYLRMVYQKYTDLGGNDIAHNEYDFINDYYNNQGWNN